MNKTIGIIGLGYVGLPLAIEFGKKFHTVGFDINQKRVDELNSGFDRTLEIENEDLKEVLSNKSDIGSFKCTTRLDEIKDCKY